MSDQMETRFTEKQGQYLAFIQSYSTLHGRPPSEWDMERFFGTTPPTIHQMILRLEQKRLLKRVPGEARSIRLTIPAEELPVLKPRGTGSPTSR